jgi:hypothetical protein
MEMGGEKTTLTAANPAVLVVSHGTSQVLMLVVEVSTISATPGVSEREGLVLIRFLLRCGIDRAVAAMRCDAMVPGDEARGHQGNA